MCKLITLAFLVFFIALSSYHDTPLVLRFSQPTVKVVAQLLKYPYTFRDIHTLLETKKKKKKKFDK